MGSSSPEPAPARRRRRGRKRRVVALALVLLAVAALIGRLYLDTWAARLLTSRLSIATGGVVEVGAIHVELLPLRVQVRDLELRVSESEPAGPLTVQLPSARVDLGWRGAVAATRGRIDLDSVRLERPTVRTREATFSGDGRGAASPVALSVGRFTVRDGTWQHSDREVPLNVDVEALRLDGSWSDAAILGTFAAGATVELAPGPSRRIEVETGFRLRGVRIDLFETRIRGEGLDAVLAGTWDPAARPALAAQGRIEADLAWAAPYVAGVSPLSGRVRGPFRVSVVDGAVEATGDIEADALRIDRFRLQRLEAQARYEGGNLALSSFRARAYGGTVEGSVDFSLGSEAAFFADAAVSGFAADGIFSLVRVPLPLDCDVDGEITLGGPVDRIRDWSGSGRFTAQRRGGTGVAIGGGGTVELSDGRIRIEAGPVRAGSAELGVSLAASVEPDGRPGLLVIQGETWDAAATQRATLKILRGLGIAAPELVRRPLAGSGGVSARVELGGSERIRLGLGLRDGGWGSQRFDRASLDLEVGDGRIAIERIDIADDEQRIAGRAVFDESPPAPRDVDLELVGIRVEELWPWLGIEPLDISGCIDGRVDFRKESGTLSGGGELTLEGAIVYGERFDSIRTRLALAGERLHLHDLEASGPGRWLRGEAVWSLDRELLRVELVDGRVTLEEVDLVRREGLPFTGTVALDGRLRVDDSGLRGTLDVAGDDLHVMGFTPGAVSGALDFAERGLALSLESTVDDGWHLGGEIAWDDALTANAELTLDDAVIDPWSADEGAPWGRVRGILRAAGPLARPDELIVEGTLDAVTVAVGPRRVQAAEPVRLSWSEGRVAMEPVRFRGGEFDFVVGGAYTPETDAILASCRGTVDLGTISAVFPDLRAKGVLDASVEVGGTSGRPSWSGEVAVDGARLRWLEWGQTLDELSGRVVFEGAHARVVGLRGVMGGGELRGDGELDFTGAGPLVELALNGSALAVEYPEGFHAIYDADVDVTYGDDELLIAGTLRIVQGLYEEAIGSGSLLGAAGREYTPTVIDEDATPVRLQLVILADDGVWVRNDLLEIESQVSLRVGGTVDRPEVIGRIGLLEGGSLRFRRQDYRVLSGSLDFFDVDRIDPYITFLAETTVDEYEVRLRIEGRMDHFEYELTSTPTLNQQDIIALLSTGRSPEAFGAGDDSTEFTGDMAANYFAGALTGLFERQLERKLGLERFQIDPLLVEGEADPTTRVTLGKRVSKDVLVVVSSDLGSTGRQIYKIEWRAAKNLKFKAVRDTSEGVGGDAVYTRRYWWKKQDAEAFAEEQAARSRGGDPDGALFGTVTVTGVDDEEALRLVETLDVEPGTAYSRSRMYGAAQSLRRTLAAEGRIDATITVESTRNEGDPPWVAAIYRVDPGRRSEILFEGIESDKRKRRLRKALEEIWSRALYTEDRYTDALRLVREELQQDGFYAADVQLEVEEREDLVVLRFLVDTGRPVVVSEVVLEGVSAIPAERVRRQILTRPGAAFARKRVDPTLLEEDRNAIRALYRDQGFLEAVVPAPQVRLAADGSSARVTFRVDEGPRFRLGEVGFSGDLPLPEDELRGWAAVEAGGVYSPGNMLLAESRLRAGLDERGYPDARIRGTATVGEDKRVDVVFSIDAGSSKTVGAIRISGNTVTRDKVIRRQLELREGDLISREKVLRSQHQIYRLGLFRSVDISYAPLPGDGTRYRLDVVVEEARPLSMSFGLGYDTESQVRASFSTTNENVGGMDRTLGIQTYASSIRRRLQLVGKEPRLFDSRLPALGTLFWEEREEVGFTVESRSAAVRIDRKLKPRWNGYARFSFKRDDLSDVTDEIAVEEEKLENIRLGNLGFGLVRSTRDDPILPTRGTLLTVNPELFDDWLLSDASFVRVTAAWNRVDTFRNRLTWSSSVRVGVAEPFDGTERVPISERFFTGGSSTLRGFERDEAGPTTDDGTPSGGQGLLLLNTELDFPMWRKLRGVVFYDTGNVWEDADRIALDDMRHVLGAGLRLTTPIGPLRLEYGHKVDREPDESAGELFLAIGRTF